MLKVKNPQLRNQKGWRIKSKCVRGTVPGLMVSALDFGSSVPLMSRIEHVGEKYEKSLNCDN